MFRTARPFFKFCYYVSSLFLSYFLIVVYIAITKFNIILKIISGRVSICEYLSLYNNQNNMVINCHPIALISILVLLCLIASLGFSFWTKRLINRTILRDYRAYNTLTPEKFTIGDKYNVGFREFIMSVIIPVISMFSIVEQPIQTFVIIVIIQLITYYFYANSSDIFPNITLVFLGYTLFYGKKVDDGRNCYVFGLTKEVDSIILSERYVLPLGKQGATFKNYVGVIVKESE